MRGQLLIGQLAQLAGVKSDTIRFYERSRLLPPPVRTAAGYRVYDEAAVRRVRFIKKAQLLGFTLEEVRQILNLRGRGRETCDCVLAMAESTLAETDAKLKELQRLRDALARNLKRWKRNRTRKAAAEFCALIEMSEDIGSERTGRGKPARNNAGAENVP